MKSTHLEIIQLDKITKKMLENFKKANNFNPDPILDYLDGSSEDQFKEVVVKEMNQMKKASCEKINKQKMNKNTNKLSLICRANQFSKKLI